jgi:hypothetical protein
MPNTNMATFGTRLYSRLTGLWIKATLHKADPTDFGTRDMTRLVVQRTPGQTSDLAQFQDENGNLLAGIDNGGALYLGGTPAVKEFEALVTIPAASITGVTAGLLGNAAGVPLVADPPAGSLVQLLSAVMSYTFATAAYTGGGNVTINSDGGSALTGLVSMANSLGAAASNITQFVPLAAAGTTLLSAKGLNLVAASAPTQPGTAAGTIKVYVQYRIYSSL